MIKSEKFTRHHKKYAEVKVICEKFENTLDPPPPTTEVVVVAAKPYQWHRGPTLHVGTNRSQISCGN